MQGCTSKQITRKDSFEMSGAAPVYPKKSSGIARQAKSQTIPSERLLPTTPQGMLAPSLSGSIPPIFPEVIAVPNPPKDSKLLPIGLDMRQGDLKASSREIAGHKEALKSGLELAEDKIEQVVSDDTVTTRLSNELYDKGSCSIDLGEKATQGMLDYFEGKCRDEASVHDYTSEKISTVGLPLVNKLINLGNKVHNPIAEKLNLEKGLSVFTAEIKKWKRGGAENWHQDRPIYPLVMIITLKGKKSTESVSRDCVSSHMGKIPDKGLKSRTLGFYEKSTFSEEQIQEPKKYELTIFHARNDNAPEGYESLVHRSPAEPGRVIFLARFKNSET